MRAHQGLKSLPMNIKLCKVTELREGSWSGTLWCQAGCPELLLTPLGCPWNRWAGSCLQHWKRFPLASSTWPEQGQWGGNSGEGRRDTGCVVGVPGTAPPNYLRCSMEPGKVSVTPVLSVFRLLLFCSSWIFASIFKKYCIKILSRWLISWGSVKLCFQRSASLASP